MTPHRARHQPPGPLSPAVNKAGSYCHARSATAQSSRARPFKRCGREERFSSQTRDRLRRRPAVPCCAGAPRSSKRASLSLSLSRLLSLSLSLSASLSLSLSRRRTAPPRPVPGQGSTSRPPPARHAAPPSRNGMTIRGMIIASGPGARIRHDNARHMAPPGRHGVIIRGMIISAPPGRPGAACA